MKKVIFIILAVAGWTLVLSSCFMVTPNVSGTWLVTLNFNNISSTKPATINQQDNSVIVNMGDGYTTLSGTVSGNSINLSGDFSDDELNILYLYKFTGTVNGNTMSGTWRTSTSDISISGTWSAVKQ